MNQPGSFKTDRTCPKCREENALSAEIIDEEYETDQIQSGPRGTTFRYTTTLYVDVSCKYCGLLGSTTLSRSNEGGPGDAKAGSPAPWGAQACPAIDPDRAIAIIVDRQKHPRYRRTAPW